MKERISASGTGAFEEPDRASSEADDSDTHSL